MTIFGYTNECVAAPYSSHKHSIKWFSVFTHLATTHDMSPNTFGKLRRRWNASQAFMEYVTKNEMGAIELYAKLHRFQFDDTDKKKYRRLDSCSCLIAYVNNGIIVSARAHSNHRYSMKSHSRPKQNKYCIFQTATESNRLYAIFGVTIHSKSIRNVRHAVFAVIALRLCSSLLWANGIMGMEATVKKYLKRIIHLSCQWVQREERQWVRVYEFKW